VYLIEWGFWRMAIESEAARKAYVAEMTPAENRAMRDFYEGDLEEEVHFRKVSENPRARGPVYSFNENFLEMRCGGSEEKRGIITLMTLGSLGPMTYSWLNITLGSIYINATQPEFLSVFSVLFSTYMILLGGATYYIYAKYGFSLSRLEMLTSRHLLIRFNRKTQQVHLHRPGYCGGIVTFPWKTTGSTAIDPEDDSLSMGMRLGLVWHPSRTGLPHMEMTLLGKQGQGGSELRDEWEFIRRYMEEGLSLLLCWRPRWPKVIREAGLPGKPVPPVTTLSDYPPAIQARLLANADRWQLKPGKRPAKKPRKPRRSKAQAKPAAPNEDCV